MKKFSEFITEAGTTPHEIFHAAGWKMHHSYVEDGPGNHRVHVYTHPEHAGHEIRHKPQLDAFEHHVKHGTHNLAKHLAAHHNKHIDAQLKAINYADAQREADSGTMDDR